MPPATRPLTATMRVVAIGLLAALLAPSVAVAQPLLPDDAVALGRQSAVAASSQVVVTWERAALGSTKAERLASLQQASRTRRVSGAAGAQAQFVRPFGTAGTTAVYRFKDPLGRRAGLTIDAIAKLPGVAAVEPDPWVTIDTPPNDYRADLVWGALGPGDVTAYGTATYGVNADDAWATTTGSGVKVAVIDTGWVNHTDLAGQNLPGYDFISDTWTANDGGGRDSDPSDAGDWITAADHALYPECPVGDSSWHGMHVSGTIAAIANNVYGTFGVAPAARIVPVRALGKCGGSMTDIADALTWAYGGAVSGVPANANPVDVINMSLGGQAACPAYMQTAIANARAAGVVVAVAAGNEAIDVAAYAPANCVGSFVVAATDIAGKRSSFSNYGSIVDIAAPGSAIVSTYNSGTTTPDAPPDGDWLIGMNGTSMATPHVAAVAALLVEDYPTAQPAAIEYAITHGVTAFAADGAAHACTTVNTCGAGIANAPAALASLASIDRTAPAATVTRPAQYTKAAAPAWSVTFNETVTGLTAGDLSTSGTATGCSVQTPTGSGTTWAVAVSGCSQGTVTLTLAARAVADAIGNVGPAAAAAAAAVTIDRTAPQSTGTVAGAYTTLNEALVAYTVSDASPLADVKVYVSTSAALTGATLCGATSGTPAASGTVTCLVPAVDATYHLYAVAGDLAGNGEAAPATADDIVIRDTASPTASVTGPPSPTSADPLAFSVTFSETVTGLAAADFSTSGTATGCVVGTPSGGGTTWSVGLAACGNGVVDLILGALSVADGNANVGPASPASSGPITINRSTPVSAASIAATVTRSSPVSVAFTVSAAASAVTSVTAYSSTTAALAAPTPCGSVTNPAATGTISCDVPVTNGVTYHVYTRATDAEGKTEAAPVTADDTILVDTTDPTVVVTAPATPTNAAALTYAITASEAVAGLTSDDVTRGGTATGCAVGTPTGSGASWSVQVTGCSAGTVSLVLAAGRLADAAGNTGPAADTTAATVTIDRTGPAVSAPTVTPRSGQKLVGTALPVSIAWTGSDPGGSGITSYGLQRSTDGGATWTTVATTTATSFATTMPTTGRARFRVAATDVAGNASTGPAGAATSAVLVQQASGVTYTKTWSKSARSNYSGGSVKWSRTARASASFTFTGRSIAFITTKAPTRGKVRIYVNGTLQGTYDLKAASTAYRTVAWQRTWTTSARRTVRIVVLATAGRPRVDVDAFAVIR